MKNIGNTIKKVIRKGLVGALIVGAVGALSVSPFKNENPPVLIKRNNFLDREYLSDTNGDGIVDRHYRIIDTLRPYHYCLRMMPLKVTEEDQKLYENLIKEEI